MTQERPGRDLGRLPLPPRTVSARCARHPDARVVRVRLAAHHDPAGLHAHPTRQERTDVRPPGQRGGAGRSGGLAHGCDVRHGGAAQRLSRLRSRHRGARPARMSRCPIGPSRRRWAAPRAGFGLVLYLSTGQSTLQLAVPDDRRGRVLALWAMTLSASAPIGHLLAGTRSRWSASGRFSWRWPQARPRRRSARATCLSIRSQEVIAADDSRSGANHDSSHTL